MLSLIIKKLRWHKSILALVLILTLFCTLWFQQINYFENYIIKNLADPTLPYYVAGVKKNSDVKVDKNKVVKKIDSVGVGLDIESVSNLQLDRRTWLSTAPAEFLPTTINKQKWIDYKYTDTVVPVVLGKAIVVEDVEFPNYKLGQRVKLKYLNREFELEIIGFGGNGFNKIPVEFLRNIPDLQLPVTYYFFNNENNWTQFLNDNVDNGFGDSNITSGEWQIVAIKKHTNYLKDIGYWIAIISLCIIAFFGYQLSLYERKTLRIFYMIGISDKQVRQFYILYGLSLVGLVLISAILLYFALNLSQLNLVLKMTHFEPYITNYYPPVQ